MAKNKVTYLKLLVNIKLNDGTTIDKGTSVKMNYKEGPFLNVELLENKNIKKIFWITEDQAKFSTARNQNWNKKMLEEHIKDIEETWFDEVKKNDSSTIDKKQNLINVEISSKPVIKKRGRPKKTNDIN